MGKNLIPYLSRFFNTLIPYHSVPRGSLLSLVCLDVRLLSSCSLFRICCIYQLSLKPSYVLVSSFVISLFSFSSSFL